MKSEEDVIVTSADAPRRGCGLVLRNLFHTYDTSNLIVTTKLQKNQTSYNAATIKVEPTIATILVTTPEFQSPKLRKSV